MVVKFCLQSKALIVVYSGSEILSILWFLFVSAEFCRGASAKSERNARCK